MRVIISSGHGKHVRGAKGYLDEAEEARRVVERVAQLLRAAEVEVNVFHDDVSKTQSANLKRIVAFHNSQQRDLDISVHFNAHKKTAVPMGTEVLYVLQQALAAKVSKAIADAGRFINRGAKKRTNLAFLNRTKKPAILIEICFVDSQADANAYRKHFDEICRAIAAAIAA